MDWRRIGPVRNMLRTPRRWTQRVRQLMALLILLVACSQKATPRSVTPLAQPGQENITPSRAVEQLDSTLRARIARDSGDVGLALIDLETGIRLGINEDVSMHAASTVKVPVMLEIFRQAERQGT